MNECRGEEFGEEFKVCSFGYHAHVYSHVSFDDWRLPPCTGIKMNLVIVDSARDLFDIIEPHLAYSTNRSHATPVETQFISAMSFFRS